MNFSRYSTIKLIIIICASYALFLAGIVWVESIDYSTAMRIDLTDPESCQVYLREGVERNTNISPETDTANWINVTGKSWSISKSEFTKNDKQPMFTPTDLPVKYYTYQMNFHVTSDTMSYIRRNALVPGLYIDAIADNWEIFINGHLIKREIYLDENGDIINHRNVIAYSVPFDKNHLKEGDNTLTIHIASNPNTSDNGIYYNSEFYIDDIDEIDKDHADFFLLFFTGITAFMGLYNLLVFMGNPKEKAYLYFALAQFLLAVYIFTNTSWISVIIINSQVSKTLEYISLTLLPICAALFTKAIAREKFGIFMRIVTMIQFIIVALLPFGGVEFSLDLLIVSEVCMIITLSYALITAFIWLRKSARTLNDEGKVTLRGFSSVLLRTVMGNTFIGLIFVLIFSVFGVIRTMFLGTDQNSVIVGLFAFVLSVSLALQNEVTETKHQIVLQNEELEGKVASRTRDLEEQTEIAVNASKTKSRFLATMSHEIRTPMNAIIGISEILLQGNDLQSEVRDGIDKIHHSGKNLLGIINDILDLSKAESGKLEIIPTEFMLPSLINDTVQLNIVRIGSKPIEFKLSLSENLPEKLIGDELRIKQILNNILSNAFKYTDKGSVKFDISGEKTDSGFIIIYTVTDTGQGMHEAELQTLFDEYSQFNKIANRKTEGTGLGMNITGQLISLMSGTIDVKSTFGTGSTFAVSLPLEVLPETALMSESVRKRLCSFTFGATEKIGERRKRVRDYMPYGTALVVDDVATNLYVAEGLMKPYGIKVTVASSGFEAIDIINSGKTFDIIFMDHMMPEMDGVETVKKLREMGYTLPVAALTANALVGNETIFKDSGFDDYISKPIDVRELNRILIKFVRDNHPEQGKSTPPETAESPQNVNAKILEVFIKDVKKAVILLPEQFEKNDLKNLAITAHGMKSAAANAGEVDVSEIAKSVELAAKENDKETVSKKLPKLIEMLKQILEKADKAEIAQTNGKEKLSDVKQKEWLTNAAQYCGDYDESEAVKIIAKMREFELADDIYKLLENIEDLLLHAEFEEAAEKISGKLKNLYETSVYN